MIVLPPGPFPPPVPAEGVVDLAWEVLREHATAAWLRGSGREALAARLREALRTGRLALASEVTRAFLDTWPLASLVDAARATWAEHADGSALAVLARTAAIVALAREWAEVPGAPWPLPDAAWIRAHAGDEPEVRRRDRSDGAEEVAGALGVEVAGAAAVALPPFADVDAADLVARRARLGRRLALGEIEAVRVHGRVTSPEARLALGEIRLEGRRQAALEAVGLAGLLVAHLPDFAAVLSPAPAGRPGETLRTACTWAAFPGTPGDLARERMRPVLYLLWDGPHPPVAVEVAAGPVLAAFKEGAPAAGQPADVVEALLAAGALTAG